MVSAIIRANKNKVGERMKLLHTADWHLGKKLHGYDLIADQKYILDEILTVAKSEEVDAIIIAGDIYDRAVASSEAIQLGNQVLHQWNLEEGFPLLVISGNHDSAIRLATGKEWFKSSQYYLKTTIHESLQPVEFGDCQFYLLPYIELMEARLFIEKAGLIEEAPNDLSQVLKIIIDEMKKTFNPNKKQIFVGHLFVAGSLRQDSETPLEIGGLQSVAVELFDCFHYAAFGHLHSPKAIQKGKVRYSGAPLKYSVGEYSDQKGVQLIDTDLLATDFSKAVRFVPLKPLREVRKIEASFEDLLYQRGVLQKYAADFLAIELTNEEVIVQLMNQLRPLYPNLLTVSRKLQRKEQESANEKLVKVEQPLALIQDFFLQLSDEPLTDQQQAWIEETLSEIQGKEGAE